MRGGSASFLIPRDVHIISLNTFSGSADICGHSLFRCGSGQPTAVSEKIKTPLPRRAPEGRSRRGTLTVFLLFCIVLLVNMICLCLIHQNLYFFIRGSCNGRIFLKKQKNWIVPPAHTARLLLFSRLIRQVRRYRPRSGCRLRRRFRLVRPVALVPAKSPDESHRNTTGTVHRQMSRAGG